MKINQLINTSLVLIVLVIALSPVLISAKTKAADNAMYIVPSSTTVLNGNAFNIDIRGNAASYNAAQIDISYPAGQIEYKGYSLTGSSLPNPAPHNISGGLIKLSIYTIPGPISGDTLLARVSFTAKVGSGSGSITLLSSSDLYNENALSVSKIGAFINFASPSSTTPPSTPPPSNTPITNPASPTNNNGGSNNGSTSGSSSSSTKTNEPTVATPENPLPAQNPTPTEVSVTIVIKDLSGRLVKNSTVKVNDKILKTNNKGEVRYEGPAYGVLTVSYVSKAGEETKLGAVTLVKGAANDKKYDLLADVNLPYNPIPEIPIAQISSIAAILLLLGGSAILIGRFRHNRREMLAHGLISEHKPIISSEQTVSSNNTVKPDSGPTSATPSTIIKPTTTEELSDAVISDAAKKIIDNDKTL